LKTILYN